ncbi:hypothetical protein B0H13DRAFT_2383416 [Mycena leptocephala]|nr:hypothetical protein B0H13DRAFT_2383416 [Mycena leptocephala]
MIAARVKQTRSANRKRQPAPFENGDLVYLNPKNLKFEKGLARKLIPKFIGPYSIKPLCRKLSKVKKNGRALHGPSTLIPVPVATQFSFIVNFAVFAPVALAMVIARGNAAVVGRDAGGNVSAVAAGQAASRVLNS